MGSHRARISHSVRFLLLCALFVVPCWVGSSEGADFGFLSPGPFYRMKVCDKVPNTTLKSGRVLVCPAAVEDTQIHDLHPNRHSEREFLLQAPEEDSGCGLCGGACTGTYAGDFGSSGPLGIYSYRLEIELQNDNCVSLGKKTTPTWLSSGGAMLRHVCVDVTGINPNGYYVVHIVEYSYPTNGGSPIPSERDAVLSVPVN
jgi:hypothetical protein